MTFDQALVYCMVDQRHLAFPNDTEEVKEIKRLFAEFPSIPRATIPDRAFIGIHDRKVEGEFQTIFGKLMFSFLK